MNFNQLTAAAAAAAAAAASTQQAHAAWSAPGQPAPTATQQQQQQQQQQPQATHHPHHPVVTDHSTLAYMAHAYQSAHTNQANAIDHHHHHQQQHHHHHHQQQQHHHHQQQQQHNPRSNAHNGPMSTQPIGSQPQASTYTVDSLYNSPAAAVAAVAAYGYNNYNAAAFFQTSNNNPHTQTSGHHPSQANLSTFWNQTQQPTQQQHHQQHHHQQQKQTTHAALNNQAASVQSQQRQPEANYMHDPRLYYGRPAYGNQAMQNFGQPQHQHQAPQTQQQQADVLQRMAAITQQHQLLQHHEQQQQQLHQLAAHQQHQHQPQVQQSHPLNSAQHQTPQQQYNHQLQASQVALQHPVSQQHDSAATLSGNAVNPTLVSVQSNRQQLVGNVVARTSPQHEMDKNPVDLESRDSKNIGATMKNQPEYDLNATNTTISHQANQLVGNKDNVNILNKQNPQVIAKVIKDVQPQSSIAPINKSTNAPTTTETNQSIKYSRKPQTNTLTQSSQNRNVYREQQERNKPQNDPSTTDDRRGGDFKNRSSPTNARQQSLQESSDQISPFEDGIAALSINSSKKTTWASIASQPAKVSQPKSLKSKIAGSNSVLSSAKHLAAVSLDSSPSESKNGINPAIKSSVSAAATSMARSSVPPPISKLPAAVANIKLNLLGEENIESSRISWPAVNASIDLSLDDSPPPPPQPKEASNNNNLNYLGSYDDRMRRDNDNNRGSGRDYRDSNYRDHNHNHGANNKMVNSYRGSHPHESGPPAGRDSWNRREPRDYRRVRRDSDRRDSSEREKQMYQNDEHREPFNRRLNDYHKPSGIRANQSFRGDERDQYRDRDFIKRDANHRGGGIAENYQPPRERFPRNHHQPPPTNAGRHNDNAQHTQHHHYNNVRDGNTAGNSLSKIDLSVHPHLNPENFNPKTFNLEPSNARYFIIKSYSEDDIHRSIKYSIWCSTNHGNERLDEAYKQQQAKEGPIYLFFSVNGSGHFCGMAQMMSSVDFDSSSGVWAQSKWQGEFSVKWIYVKDVPNSALRHITLENNEDKPVTNSRDTQEVPSEKGKAVLKILHQFPHTTSIFDDFLHYERRQEEEKFKKSHNEQQSSLPPQPNRSEERERYGGFGGGGMGPMRGPHRPFSNSRPHNDFHNNRDRLSRFAS